MLEGNKQDRIFIEENITRGEEIYRMTIAGEIIDIPQIIERLKGTNKHYVLSAWETMPDVEASIINPIVRFDRTGELINKLHGLISNGAVPSYIIALNHSPR